MPDPTDAVPTEREHLTPDEVAKVAKLALLELSEDERNRFARQLDAVLDLADRLDGFDLDDVPPTAHPFGLTNVFRNDVPDGDAASAEFRRLALDGGPDVEDGRFKVPPALGEAP